MSPKWQKPVSVESILLRFLKRLIQKLRGQERDALQGHLAVMAVQLDDRIDQTILLPARLNDLRDKALRRGKVAVDIKPAPVTIIQASVHLPVLA
jgi:hypothetical protein